MYQDGSKLQSGQSHITAETFVFNRHERLTSSTLQVFVEGFNDYLETIEESLQQLDVNPKDFDAINCIFRIIHTLKGDCFMCFMEPLGIYVHILEDSLSGLRSKKIQYRPLVKAALLAALDLVVPVVESMVNKNRVEADKLADVANCLQTLSRATPETQDDACSEIIRLLSGEVNQPDPTVQTAQEELAPLYPLQDKNEQLAYFCSLSTLFEYRNPRWKNKTCSISFMAIKLNKEMGEPVHEEQLEAAVYIHDIGLAFYDDELLNSISHYHLDRKAKMLVHPDVGAQFLSLMPHWRDAAEIVLQHHERPDGTGYPLRLTGDQICVGAKILSLAVHFDMLINGRDKYTEKHSIVKAAAEINALKGVRFDADVVDAFNRIIRRDYNEGETLKMLH